MQEKNKRQNNEKDKGKNEKQCKGKRNKEKQRVHYLFFGK